MYEFKKNPLETVGGVVFTRSFPYIFYRGKIIKGYTNMLKWWLFCISKRKTKLDTCKKKTVHIH